MPNQVFPPLSPGTSATTLAAETMIDEGDFPMAMTQSIPQATTQSGVRALGGVRFDWAAALLGALLVGGAYNDAWAHEHGKVDDSFFTLWHGLLYGAMLLVAIFLAATVLLNRRRGYAWRQALPEGYMLSLVGVGIFALGGLGDMVWHMVFGIEADLDALLSPTHLLLGLGWLLIVGGPWRAAWQRQTSSASHWITWLPTLLAMTSMLSVLTFFTVYVNPFVHVLAATTAGQDGAAQGLGVSSFLVQPALLMGVVLLALRRWRLPFGSLALLITLNAALLSILHDTYALLPAALLAGLLGDLLLARAQPAQAHIARVRAFGFALPALLTALYFLTLLLSVGIAWSVHLWVGAVVLAGVVGLLLSYVALPPTVPLEQRGAPYRG